MQKTNELIRFAVGVFANLDDDGDLIYDGHHWLVEHPKLMSWIAEEKKTDPDLVLSSEFFNNVFSHAETFDDFLNGRTFDILDVLILLPAIDNEHREKILIAGLRAVDPFELINMLGGPMCLFDWAIEYGGSFDEMMKLYPDVLDHHSVNKDPCFYLTHKSLAVLLEQCCIDMRTLTPKMIARYCKNLEEMKIVYDLLPTGLLSEIDTYYAAILCKRRCENRIVRTTDNRLCAVVFGLKSASIPSLVLMEIMRWLTPDAHFEQRDMPRIYSQIAAINES